MNRGVMTMFRSSTRRARRRHFNNNINMGFHGWFFKWVFPTFFMSAFVGALCWIAFCAYIVITGVTNPEKIGEFGGSIIRGLVKGVEGADQDLMP